MSMKLAVVVPIAVACVCFRSYVPLTWHTEILYEVTRGFWRGKLTKITDVVVTKGRAWPDLLDHNMHLSNSCYNRIMDFGRYHFAARLFGFDGLVKGGSVLNLGSMAIQFIRPISPFAPFFISTRLVDYDEKWMVIEQKVSSKIPDEAAIENANNGTVYAVGLARVVAKEGKGKDRGKTIRPEVLFKDLYQQLPPRGTAADALRILTDASVPPPTSSIQAYGKEYPIEVV